MRLQVHYGSCIIPIIDFVNYETLFRGNDNVEVVKTSTFFIHLRISDKNHNCEYQNKISARL